MTTRNSLEKTGKQKMRITPSSFMFLAVAVCIASLSFAKDQPYRAPRLSNGQPNFEGVWDDSNSTPLTRLPEGFSSLVISPEQVTLLDKSVRGFFEQPGPNDPAIQWNIRKVERIRGEWRSSILVDSADGQLPGTQAFNDWLAGLGAQIFAAMDGPEQRPTAERCLVDTPSGPPIVPNPGMNLRQIIQTDNAIVIHSEVLHDARVIRLNAKHGPAAITSWLGDSIGWWEGDTLVVETKYFTPSDPGRAVPFAVFRVSPQATVTERFTRVSAQQLDYSFTVDDPVNYTRPWRGETQFMRSQDQMFEDACHEGNYSLPYILQGARVKDGTWVGDTAGRSAATTAIK
jgi:hypothetical protein